LIADCVAKFRDEDIWEKSLEREVADKDQMDILMERMG
jgi:hypothetical protein